MGRRPLVPVCDAGVVDDVTWGVLTLSLTVLGGIWTWVTYQRRGISSGLRALAFTLLPLAAYLTKTLQMFTRIVDAVADWATNLAFSPAVWLGALLAGLSALLFVVSGALTKRGRGARGPAAETAGSDPDRMTTSGRKDELSAGPKPRSEAVVDDDLADIEAILRKRGIQ